jgi:serine/threonine protein kinase
MSQQSVVRRVIRVRKPSIVSDVIDAGLHGRIGLLAKNPSQVLKFCNPDNEKAISALNQEQKILAILGPHTYIIHLHWASEQGLCFEYYPHGSLRLYYESLGFAMPPISERVRWCHQAVIAFAYIHSKGIVHNDISARNVLLSSSMEIKVCDFGFANVIGEKLMGGPETRYCRGNSWSEIYSCVKDDLFSIGSLFYEILMGSRPFDLEESSRIRKLFDAHVFPSTQEIRPEGYGEIIRHCWHEEYSSIEAVRNDLQHLETNIHGHGSYLGALESIIT